SGLPGGPLRHLRRTHPPEGPRGATERPARRRRGSGKKGGFPAPGDAQGNQHDPVEIHRGRGDRTRDRRARAGRESGNRKDTGTGAEPGMSIVFVISAPSGSGKSTLVRRLLERDQKLLFSISYTTRAPRGQEQPGR